MEQPDPLLVLRQAIAEQQTPILTSSADASSNDQTQQTLASATHLLFASADGSRLVYTLDTPTRFISNDQPVDLRSIFFAWQNKDAAVPDYISRTQRLNEELAAPGAAAGGKVQNLVFAERLDLNSWLGGQQDDSEYLKPLEDSAALAAGSGAIAAGAAGGIATAAGVKRARAADSRLLQIYGGERRMADRNSVLRGIKATDFSHVRKQAAALLGRARARPGQPTTEIPQSLALVSNLGKKSARRPEPIILLSPSASSLLRMTNVKRFLEEGVFVPADSAAAGGSTGATILHIQRSMPSIDAQRPLRFVLVETPDQFKPDYWSRLVAVFTTGQAWQFKSYKWSSAPELFSRVLGLYVGWSGEVLPPTVRSWGRTVKAASVEKWSSSRGEAGRWQDREVVENLWSAIEESMRVKGWSRDNGFK
jgi:parafibromin